jgi:transcriptional regulator with XRE-family HTH domain
LKNSKPIVVAMKKSKMTQWQVDDARRLSAIWERKKTMSQAEFGATTGIGTQGMVHQYLAGLTPLNLSAAGKFAAGLGVLIDEISPTLADQVRELHKLCDPVKTQDFGVAPSVKAYIDQTLKRMIETRDKDV